MTASAGLLLFDGFRPGAVMGRTTERVDDKLLALWRELYPWDEAPPGGLPAGVATVLVMRAYMKVLAPRPPGNIHARQRLELAVLPQVGEEVTTELRCTGKELRKERRYVDVETCSTGADGRALFNGAMTLIWAK
jgi:hypothetical protein